MTSGFDIMPVNMTPGPPEIKGAAGLGGFVDPTTSKAIAKTDFATALAEAGNGLVQTIQQAEATSIAGIKGEATTYEVAATMMEAEQSLRMAIAVRDRIVNAYLEISRMQI